ncbi:MAG TPA: hypothetical protein DD671_15185, partial [Balneolaceae bacterium]|nr:hypothetical protein [Balneolaceae bacterium]
MRLVLLVLFIGSSSFFGNVNGQNTNPDSLFDVAKKHYDLANYAQAIKIFDESGQVFLQQGDSVNWVHANLSKGDALLNSGNVRQALDLFLFLDEQTPSAVSNSILARIQYFIGWSYRELEQYEESKKYYLEGIEFANAANDSLLTGRMNNNISYPYLYTGDYYTALSFQKKAMDIYESLGNKRSLSNVMNGTFLVLTELGLHRQAQNYIRQSLALREEIGNPHMLDIAYHNMAVNFKELGRTDSAIIYYQRSLELSRQLP